jgi:3-hydroxyisobutyrate dehydrogenase
VAFSEELAGEGEVLLSVVTADQAEAAASQTAPFLNARHLYADLNSVSPALKQKIARIVEERHAQFVEAAIMAPVPGRGHRVPMLLGGPSASGLVELLAPYGMNFEIVGESIGTAAAIKMFRSVIVKGLEALIVECVLGASRYGAAERIFASLGETFPGLDWSKLADYMVGRAVVHGERRAHEMDEVAATLRACGVDPIMAEATARRERWCAQLGLASKFGPAGPQSYQEVIDAIAASFEDIENCH